MEQEMLMIIAFVLSAVLIDLEFIVRDIISKFGSDETQNTEYNTIEKPATFMSFEYLLATIALLVYVDYAIWAYGLIIGILFTALIDIIYMMSTGSSSWRSLGQWSALYFLYFSRFSMKLNELELEGESLRLSYKPDEFLKRIILYLKAVGEYNDLHRSFLKVLILAIGTNISLIGIGLSTGAIWAYAAILPISILTLLHSLMAWIEKNKLYDKISKKFESDIIQDSILDTEKVETSYIHVVNKIFWKTKMKYFTIPIHIVNLFFSIFGIYRITLSNIPFIEILQNIAIAYFTIPFIFALLSENILWKSIDFVIGYFIQLLRSATYSEIPVHKRLAPEILLTRRTDNEDLTKADREYIVLLSQYATYNDMFMHLWDVHSQAPVIMQGALVFLIVNILNSSVIGFLAPLLVLSVTGIIQMGYWIRIGIVRVYSQIQDIINKRAQLNLTVGYLRDKQSYSSTDDTDPEYIKFRKWFDNHIFHTTATVGLVYLGITVLIFSIVAFLGTIDEISEISAIILFATIVVFSIIVFPYILSASRNIKIFETQVVDHLKKVTQNIKEPVPISDPVKYLIKSYDVYLERERLLIIDRIRFDMIFIVILSIPAFLSFTQLSPIDLRTVAILAVPVLGFVNLSMIYYLFDFVWHAPLYTTYTNRICKFDVTNPREDAFTSENVPVFPKDCICNYTTGTNKFSIFRKVIGKITIFPKFQKSPSNDGKIRFCDEARKIGDGKISPFVVIIVIVSQIALFVSLELVLVSTDFSNPVQFKITSLILILGILPIILIVYNAIEIWRARNIKTHNDSEIINWGTWWRQEPKLSPRLDFTVLNEK